MAEAKRIDGKAAAARIIDIVTRETATLTTATGVVPGLAVVIVGEDPASQVYVGSKAKTAKACGFKSIKHELPAETGEAALLKRIADLNADPEVHGILVQLPLPKHIDETKVVQAIDPDKDVDGFHLINVGRLSTGASAKAFVPCTPAGSMILIREVLGDDLSGKSAVIVGRSNIVGKPMAQLLLAADATVTIAHSRTRDLASVCRGADILVAAVGRPEMLNGAYVKDGAVVIDVGINRVDAPEKGHDEDGMPKTRLVGDVNYADASEKAAAITPVPGGVGPMTIAMLMANTLRSACRAADVAPPKF
ncbi:bifunctional methylenetetrahydrofolate dehydrogenase/methenyltetrahydrofolate cyclohydrolase FolD [Jiella sp. MQZ9-1]|uniref:Bifunctional protein FolD n=1 Tax=Jiella flava TaxID=2816857 RepID=A0A939FT83_9HYPH|nr:bifunctional methylenetetrahydrofolate dehydrogenase/methenyltetrahydrofolate cyclohydrolase FolD [Jiella flava]MBO0661122.1 bifunctional methylenetetrahydrofolate dehydrogenase/methenyltetrahydrofolate cyclohydrolase FolD [Jiella flava]MCD2469768.1 bifunctional methylenetetrahydrofolate dehydrogenase/methenyltetrahydrofolate cyclohydrolase FolD [Jiella flava]